MIVAVANAVVVVGAVAVTIAVVAVVLPNGWLANGWLFHQVASGGVRSWLLLLLGVVGRTRVELLARRGSSSSSRSSSSRSSSSRSSSRIFLVF